MSEENEQLYYVQNYDQGYVGNSMLWWKEDNCGYVCDVRKARVFTEFELEGMHSLEDGSKRAWPKEYIDMRVAHHIDMQDCKFKDVAKEGA